MAVFPLQCPEAPAFTWDCKDEAQIAKAEAYCRYFNLDPFTKCHEHVSWNAYILKTRSCRHVYWQHRRLSLWKSFRLILDSSVSLWVGIQSAGLFAVWDFPASNPAFSRGRQLVSLRFENPLPVPEQQNYQLYIYIYYIPIPICSFVLWWYRIKLNLETCVIIWLNLLSCDCI